MVAADRPAADANERKVILKSTSVVPAKRTAATKAWRDADRWVGELRDRVRDE